MSKQADWRDVFCSREVELARLVAAYESASAGSGPRLAVLCADRGMGKTRLVQELYRHLSTHCDPDDYWPDASLFKGNNLRVAPDFNDPETQVHFGSFTTAQRPMPFLWWGFRLNDPLDRNAVRSDMAGHRRTLNPHLERARFAREQAAMRTAIKHSARDMAKDAALKIGEALLESVPGVGLGKNLIEVGVGLFKTARSHVQARQQADEFALADIAGLEQRHREDIYEQTLEDLAAVLDPTAGMNCVPVVVFCDDAQFAREGGDEGALRFLDQLWKRAEVGNWPLLLVATHWAVDWTQDRRDSVQAFANAFSAVADDLQKSAVIQLSKDLDLRALVERGVPGLSRQDVEMLLGKVDGNPQVLIELVGRIQASPAWRSRHGGLSVHGRKQIEAHSCNLTTLITESLLSDATPPEVRLAMALSSLQGMQFLCPLTEAAASTMRLGAIGSGIVAAAHPLRLVVGIDAGVASFVQRAYRDAAYSLVESQLGDPSEITEGLLTAAIGMVSTDVPWSSFSDGQQRALLGVVATLGSKSADAMHRNEAAKCLLRLVELETDSANRAAYARRFADGLGELWSAISFDAEQISHVRISLEDWDGSIASYGLDQKLLEEHRLAFIQRPEEAVEELISALRMIAVHEHWLEGREDALKQHTEEAVELCRFAISRFLLTEEELAEHLMFLAELRSTTDVLDEVASRWVDEALAIRRICFETERVYSTCASLVESLMAASRWSRAVNNSVGSETLLLEAVDAVRLQRQQPDSSETLATSILGVRTLMEYLEPKVLSSDGRIMLRSIESPESLLPIVLEWADLAVQACAAKVDASILGAVIMVSGVAALVAIRAGRREQAAVLFDRCRDLAQRSSEDPSARSCALTVAAYEALSHGDLDAAMDSAAHAARVACEARLWDEHYDALALRARLGRLDLLVLMEPDAEAEDKAAVLLSALRNLRQSALSIMPDDVDATDNFSMVRKWLTDGESVDRLQPEDIDPCVHEVAVMCSDFADRCNGQERTVVARSEWMLAVLSALTLGSRSEPTEHFDYLWETAPRILRPLAAGGCELQQLSQIATALAELAHARNSQSVLRAAIPLTRELVERTADPAYRRDLAARLAMLGYLCAEENEVDQASALLEEALEVSTALVTENETETNLLELSRTLDSLETLNRRAQALDQAADYGMRRRAALERLVLISGGRVKNEEILELQRCIDEHGATAAVFH